MNVSQAKTPSRQPFAVIISNCTKWPPASCQKLFRGIKPKAESIKTEMLARLAAQMISSNTINGRQSLCDTTDLATPVENYDPLQCSNRTPQRQIRATRLMWQRLLKVMIHYNVETWHPKDIICAPRLVWQHLLRNMILHNFETRQYNTRLTQIRTRSKLKAFRLPVTAHWLRSVLIMHSCAYAAS